MRKMFSIVISIILSCQLVCAAEPDEVTSSPPQPETEAEVAAVSAPPQPEPKVEVAAVSPPGTITFSFKEADIRNVMRLIAAKAGVNIVYGPTVTGQVNMELKNVPWEQALSLVLDLNGYAYQREGNVIKVLDKDALSKEPLSTEVFVLNYAKAENAKKSVEEMLTERGKIKTDSRSNTIIVTDIPANINKMEIVLAKIDARTPQVLIETKIIEMKNTLEEDLGIKWTSLKAYTVKLQSPSRQYKSIRRGGHGGWDAASDKVTTDGNTNVTTNTTTDVQTIDTDWTTTNGVPSSAVKQYHQDNNTSLGQTITDTLSSTLLKSDIRSAVLSASDFELVLSALETQADVDLISNPRIVTANNEPAEIRVVDEYPIPDYEFDTETSQWSITGFDYKDIGVKLQVTPNISSDGYITMEIKPKVSKLIGTIPFSAGGATVNIPYVAVKEASSKLIIKSGDTLAVGGLIDEDKKDVITKIPILGDIPVLGRLFSHKDVDNVKKDIIFFITATIIDDESREILTEPPAWVETGSESEKDYNKYYTKAKTTRASQSSEGNKGYLIKK